MSLPTSVPLARVPAILGSPEAPWLGERQADAPPGYRRFACDLELHVGPESRAIFRKAAIVGLGELRREGDAYVVPIEWFAATLAPLFPVLAGELRFATDRITLDGRYLPPGGLIGYVLDRALLDIAARGTGRWFLRKVASALG